VLLDTHVWLWVAEGDVRQVGRRTRRLIERARAAGALGISTVSIFELAALHAAGRIHLARAVEAWVGESIAAGDLKVTEVTTAIAIDAGLVPPDALADPFDRLVVASARALGEPLVTRDARILDYARRTGRVRTLDAAT
jgi:PIN domain nuclease of toxin-antitoxin system